MAARLERSQRFFLQHPVDVDQYLKAQRASEPRSPSQEWVILVVVEFAHDTEIPAPAPHLHKQTITFMRSACKVANGLGGLSPASVESFNGREKDAVDAVACFWMPDCNEVALEFIKGLRALFGEGPLAFHAKLRLAVSRSEYSAYCACRKSETCNIAAIDQAAWQSLSDTSRSLFTAEGIHPPDDEKVRLKLKSEFWKTMAQNRPSTVAAEQY